MAANAKLVYEYTLLKSSGETLQGVEGFGIDVSMLDRMARGIKELAELGIQVGVVIGGGNLFRGAGLTKAGMNRVMGDHMGMPATIMNGLAMRGALHRAYVNTRLMSAIPLNGVCDSYSWAEAVSLLYNNCVAILSAGTGSPFFITGSTVCLRGIEIETDVASKATKADGMFTADPAKNLTATTHEQPTYSEVLEKELKVIDLVAFTPARDHKLPIRVLNINKPGALRRVVVGEKEGTLIME